MAELLHMTFSQEQMEDLIAALNRRVDAGDIRIELCGHLNCVPNEKGFTLDKTKYRMRLVDETEESVKVLIEPKFDAEEAAK